VTVLPAASAAGVCRGRSPEAVKSPEKGQKRGGAKGPGGKICAFSGQKLLIFEINTIFVRYFGAKRSVRECAGGSGNGGPKRECYTLE